MYDLIFLVVTAFGLALGAWVGLARILVLFAFPSSLLLGLRWRPLIQTSLAAHFGGNGGYILSWVAICAGGLLSVALVSSLFRFSLKFWILRKLNKWLGALIGAGTGAVVFCLIAQRFAPNVLAGSALARALLALLGQ
jgi:hypothetical protein